jgi:hypothetical protein
MKLAVGESHFTWAVCSLLGLADDWAGVRSVPMEYVFDNAGKPVKREMVAALEFADTLFPGHYAGQYSFRNRRDVLPLQAVDLFAWTCFQQFRAARFKHPLHPIADESGKDYANAKNSEWREVQSLNRLGIERWVEENRNNPRTKEIIAFKAARRQKTGG